MMYSVSYKSCLSTLVVVVCSEAPFVTSGQLGLVPPARSGVGTVLSCSATADIDIYTSQTGLTTEDVPPSQQLIFQTAITGGQREEDCLTTSAFLVRSVRQMMF